MTEICSSSREPKWANTPDLLMPVTSASAPIDRPSSPMCEASVKAASRMVARVCCPLCKARAGVEVSAIGYGPRIERSCYFAEKHPHAPNGAEVFSRHSHLDRVKVHDLRDGGP